MNTLMTLAVVDSCCVKVCKHCSYVEVSPSAWDGFINDLSFLLWGVLGTLVIIFLIKYGVEYYKTNKEYLKQIESDRNNRHAELKLSLEEIRSAIKKVINNCESLCKQMEEIKDQNKQLKEQIEQLNDKIMVLEQKNTNSKHSN